MLGGLGMWELLIIFGIVLLLFGAKRLPGIASGLGGAVNNFKKSMREGKDEFESSANDEADAAKTKLDDKAAEPGQKVPEQIVDKQSATSSSTSSTAS